MARTRKSKRKKSGQIIAALKEVSGDLDFTPENIVAFIKKLPRTTEEIMSRFSRKRAEVHGMMGDMAVAGSLVCAFGGKWCLEKKPVQNRDLGLENAFESDKNNQFLFGFASDQHLCSRYERLEVLNDLYDKFQSAGVNRVYNSGNWIDGECNYNRHELIVHGVEGQCQYMADNYPKRDGIHTYAVAGDDHEGWFCSREGINIGRYAANVMKDSGRDDWTDLGYMECFVPLMNRHTNKSSMLAIIHPGGGSCYAHSYAPQKIIESLDGGEKPAVALFGHFHKMGMWNIRNVWSFLVGCCQDQTSFMRKKRIEAHVGGGIARLTQDPDTGAITGCAAEFFRYFNTGYYNNRWSKSGPVTLPKRRAA